MCYHERSDFELAGTLNPALNGMPLEPFFRIGEAFQPRTTKWRAQTEQDYLLLLVRVPQDQYTLFIGFSLLPSLSQASFKTSSLILPRFNLAGTPFNTTDFLNQATLPLSLDLLLAKHALEQANLTSLVLDLNGAQFGYTIDFVPQALPSFQAYKHLTTRIEAAFRFFCLEQELASHFSVTVASLTFARLDEFQLPFRSLTLIISLVTLLTTTWFIQLLTQAYLKAIAPLLARLRTRGLTPN